MQPLVAALGNFDWHPVLSCQPALIMTHTPQSAATDGHGVLWLIDEYVPGLATVAEDVVVGCKTRLKSQLSRMNC